MGTETDDDDNDRIANLLEYALGLDPQVPDPSPGTIENGGVTFQKGSEAVENGDLIYELEASLDLKEPWTVVTPTIDTPDAIRYVFPTAEQPRLFVRLKVTRIDP